MKVKFGRWGVSALVAVVVAIPAAAAFAIPIVPGTPRQGSLIEVGPVAASTGFPTWYRGQDSAGVTSRLELCLPLSPGVLDPLCPAPFTANEMFYQLVTSPVVAQGVNMLIEMNLEAAYATGPVVAGDEIVFGRIRIRDTKTGFTPGTIWRITHPYGIDEVTADAKGQMNMTQDIGLAPGDFGAALAGRVGPFLKWDPAVAPAAPAGYIGDPNSSHTVVGSPYNTNFVKVERKELNGTYTLLAQTDQFLVSGRYATNSGVSVPRAVYTLPASGHATIDVFATSEVGQSIQVSANAELGFATTTLRDEGSRYFGRLPLTVPPSGLPVGAQIEVVNAGDKPIARKIAKLADGVTISAATYTVGDVGAPGPDNTLVVTASSSDEVNAPVLTVAGYGPLVAGTASFPINAPPSTITVTSSRGGSATIATSVAGSTINATLPIAAFAAPATVTLGQPVVLDAATSTGGPLTYAWAQMAGTGAIIPAMDMTTPTLTFTPTAVGTYVIQLVVTGPTPPGLVSVPTSQTITVLPAAVKLQADAGPSQTAQRGTVVTLDASATTGAQSLAWTQLSGPLVTLSSATATKPTFSYSLMPLPNALVGGVNLFYVTDNASLTFQVTATGVGGAGTSTATVVITPLAELISGVTARYRTRGEWRITGTTSILAGQRVTFVVGGPDPTGRTIGSATVDPAGAFSIRGGIQPDPRVPGPAATQVTVVTATGGMATFALNITP